MQPETLFFPIILTNVNSPWEAILSEGTPVVFPAKRMVPCSRMDSSDSGMYFIKRGRIRLSNIAPNGQEKVLMYMGQGMLFNEIPMIHLATDYIFTAMERTEAVFLSKTKLSEDFARKNPELVFNMLASISKKAQNFYSQLCSQRTFDSFTNTCRTLYCMYLYQRTDDTIVPQLTQQELAAFLGIHRSSLHKGLSRLKEEGVIDSYNRNALTIHDPERLLAYATAIE